MLTNQAYTLPPRMEAILSLVKEGLLRPHVSHSFPLEKVNSAAMYFCIHVAILHFQAVDGLAAKWERKVIGGAVIDCS